jgi:hypothetical protein
MLHVRLHNRFVWYRNWHHNSKHVNVHWGSLIVICLVVSGFLLSQMKAYSLDFLTASADVSVNGLKAYFPLDDSSSLARDLSPTGNNGTIMDNPGRVAGKVEGAMQFDGNDEIQASDTHSIEGMSALTIAGWFKMDSLPTQNYSIFGKEQAYRIIITNNGNGHLVVATKNNPWYSPGTTVSWDWSPPVVPNQWYHVVGIYDGSYLKIYLNGVLQGTSAEPISGVIENTSFPFTIGNAQASTIESFKGTLDDVRVYDRALSITEVGDLYALSSTSPNSPVPSFSNNLQKLKTSADGRYLIKNDGSQFFYLADTAWAILPELEMSEIDFYLQNRADKKFNAIQTVALWLPQDGFVNGDISQPKEGYWSELDYVIGKTESLGMYITLLPTWGSEVANGHINISNAQAYGQFLGSRYKNHPIIWCLGGDHVPTGYEAVWDALAKGIAIGISGSEDYTQFLMTFHPYGGQSSATYFHNRSWLDFNTIQTGHNNSSFTYAPITGTYIKVPAKPVVDGEPGYENIPNGLIKGAIKLNDWDIRKFAYQAVFAGAFGHAYGANEVYMFWDPGDNTWGAQDWGASLPWQQAVDLPGANQMQHLKQLMESKNMLTLVPDQNIIYSSQGSGNTRVQAIKSSNGLYSFVYVTDGHPISINSSKMAAGQIKSSWFNPRTGVYTFISQSTNTGAVMNFTPPTSGVGNDWVLVLENQIPPAYTVGVNYHATGSDFATTPFIRQYNVQSVRDTVKTQLQSMANSGATTIKTVLWLVDDPAQPMPDQWRLTFPISTQEITNLKNYAEDVASIRAADGHKLELQISLAWLGCADYTLGSYTTTVGYCNYTWSDFLAKAKTSIDSVVATLGPITNSDGRKIVETLYLDLEIRVTDKANQKQFLKDLYPYFLSKTNAAGLNGSIYFQIDGREAEILSSTYTNSQYPILNNRKSIVWMYEGTKFLQDNNLPVPARLDFSFYPDRVSATYASLIKRVWDDIRAVYGGIPVAVSETYYLSDATQRAALGQAFAKENQTRGMPEKTVFWTTPNGGGSGVNQAFPFDFVSFRLLPAVTSPNTAVSWAIGSTQTLSWTHPYGANSYVKIELSRDGGNTWEVINNQVLNSSSTSGTYSWLVSGPATNQALIKVSKFGGTDYDISNVNFTIANQTITVTAPNTVVSWTKGTSQTIQWTHNMGLNSHVKIDLSRDNGITWEIISSDVINAYTTSGKYVWAVSGPTTIQTLIKISKLDGSVSDVSNVNFKIVDPLITVSSPNTAVSWAKGTTQRISWAHNLGTAIYTKIDLSSDNGVTWESIVGSVLNSSSSGYYDWPISGSATLQALIKVTRTDNSISDVSNVAFKIVDPIITVTAPNTAVSWAVGYTQRISWTHNLGGGLYTKVDLSRDNGVTWEPIVGSVANTSSSGYYDWTVTGPITTQALVKVSKIDDSLSDISNVTFNIADPTITVSVPNTLTTWTTSTVRRISWYQNMGSSSYVKIEISRNGGTSWETINPSIKNNAATSGYYDWTVSGPASSQALVRVSTIDGVYKDTSNTNFVIN